MWCFVRRVRWLGLLSSLGFACSCGQDPQDREQERERQREALRIAEAKKPPSRRGPVATLVGQVALAPGMQLPEYAPIDMSRIPLSSLASADARPNCAPSVEADRKPVQLTAKGLLSGVVVAASDFTRVKERAPQVHKVWIENCRLRPTIVAATAMPCGSLPTSH